MQLVTPRLMLRPVQPADSDDLYRLEQDPEVMRYLNGGVPTPLEPVDPDAVSYRMPRGREHDVWAVIPHDIKTLAGWVALHVEGNTGELGYRFFREAWGNGYATEAAQALVSDAFVRFDVVRITARTMSDNARSRRVMQRLGMRLTKPPSASQSQSVAETGDDEVEYAVERETWRP